MGAAKIQVDELLAAAIKEINQENERIESLTQARRSYYSAGRRAGSCSDGSSSGRRRGPCSRSAGAAGRRKPRRFWAIDAALAPGRDPRELMGYFDQLEDLVERVNDCETG